MKKLIKGAFRVFGADIRRYKPAPDPMAPIRDLTKEQREIISSVRPDELAGDEIAAGARPLTMVVLEGIAALANATNYITTNKIPGDIAECGVWRGGCMMVVARTLMSKGDTSRELYLYDTFEGMSSPTGNDKRYDGQPADHLLEQAPKGTGIWCYASLEEVQENLFSTGYPRGKIHFVKGKVEDTIPKVLPKSLALLRLDTDWYESTKHELMHLFPLLNKGGILIFDDYGFWQGQKKAADEFFSTQSESFFLNRIGYSGRIGVRVGA